MTTTTAQPCCTTDAPRLRVRVHAMRLGLRDDEPTQEWFASCTDADWTQPGGRGCNWYGGSRDTEAEAKADAARHRRTHKPERIDQ